MNLVLLFLFGCSVQTILAESTNVEKRFGGSGLFQPSGNPGAPSGTPVITGGTGAETINAPGPVNAPPPTGRPRPRPRPRPTSSSGPGPKPSRDVELEKRNRRPAQRPKKPGPAVNTVNANQQPDISSIISSLSGGTSSNNNPGSTGAVSQINSPIGNTNSNVIQQLMQTLQDILRSNGGDISLPGGLPAFNPPPLPPLTA